MPYPPLVGHRTRHVWSYRFASAGSPFGKVSIMNSHLASWQPCPKLLQVSYLDVIIYHEEKSRELPQHKDVTIHSISNSSLPVSR